MDVSVILINYNTKEMTSSCIESIIHHTNTITYEIILIDNNSTDGSKDVFENFHDIRYFYLSENIGFGRANNFGIEKAKGKYIFLLNTDTLLCNNAIYMLFDYLTQSDENLFIGGVLLNTYKKPTHSYGNFPTIKSLLSDYLKVYFKRIFNNGHNNKENFDFLVEKKVDYVVGADLFFRKNMLNTMGLFDPFFFMYFEETELQHRYSTLGIQSYIIKGPEIVHYEGGSFNKSHRKSIGKDLLSMRSMFYYIKKTNSIKKYYMFRFLFIIVRTPVILVDKYTFKDKCKFLKEAFKLSL